MATAGYNRTQLRAMRRFQRSESKRLGRKLTRNEAAQLWVDKGLSAQFRKAYEKKQE